MGPSNCVESNIMVLIFPLIPYWKLLNGIGGLKTSVFRVRKEQNTKNYTTVNMGRTEPCPDARATLWDDTTLPHPPRTLDTAQLHTTPLP